MNKYNLCDKCKHDDDCTKISKCVKKRGKRGKQGYPGPIGLSGPAGPAGQSSVIGYAEYNSTSNINSTLISVGTPFTIDNQVHNSIPTDIVASYQTVNTPPTPSTGSLFTLSSGVYVIDYETSLTTTGTIGIYTGASSASLVLDPNTEAAASIGVTFPNNPTIGTWIHGRSIQVINPGSSKVIAVCPSLYPTGVNITGDSTTVYLIRITILKIA